MFGVTSGGLALGGLTTNCYSPTGYASDRKKSSGNVADGNYSTGVPTHFPLLWIRATRDYPER